MSQEKKQADNEKERTSQDKEVMKQFEEEVLGPGSIVIAERVEEDGKKIKFYFNREEIDLIIEAINFRIDELRSMEQKLGSYLYDKLDEFLDKYYNIMFSLMFPDLNKQDEEK